MNTSLGEHMRGLLRQVVHQTLAYGRTTRTAGAFAVGLRELNLEGIVSCVWYPAAHGSREVKQLYGNIYCGLAAPNAEPHRDQSPLLVLSHGLRSNRYDLSWLAEALASHGYVVIAVDHSHSTAADFVDTEAMKLWERAATLSRALTLLLAHPVFGPLVDPHRIAVGGHSAGGSSALVMAGACINPELFAGMYPQSGLPEAASDPRIRAALALAPGTGMVFDAAGLACMTCPVMIVSGTHDRHTPDESCAGHFAHHIPRAAWHSIRFANHYTFKPICIAYGHVRAREICCDHAAISRRQVHALVVGWAAEFLRTHLPPA